MICYGDVKFNIKQEFDLKLLILDIKELNCESENEIGMGDMGCMEE